MKLMFVAALLVLPMSGAAEVPKAPVQMPPALQGADMPNAHRNLPGCLPIVQQVAGENRVHRGTRLDQQPPAKLLLAVDRHVDGCREVTIVRGNIGAQPAQKPRR